MRLTVIEGFNPNPPPLPNDSHLKLNDAPPEVRDKPEPSDIPVLLKFADVLIGFIANIWWSLESWRNRQAVRRSETERDSPPDTVVGRRGW